MLLGAGPHTDGLDATIQRDDDGHVLTGGSVQRDGPAAWKEPRAPLALETSVPGVFAAGDLRHGSPRGVSAAVADGAIAVRSVRDYLGLE